MKIKERYILNKNSKVGETLICPSCNASFIKKSYQQCFCKSKPKTQCKDKYWNTVDHNKHNNTTRISPASQRYLTAQSIQGKSTGYTGPSYNSIHDYEDDHPFSGAGLGQWDD